MRLYTVPPWPVNGGLGVLSNEVCGGNQQARVDLIAVRIAEKAIDVLLGDRVGRVVALGLDSPEVALVCLGQ